MFRQHLKKFFLILFILSITLSKPVFQQLDSRAVVLNLSATAPSIGCRQFLNLASIYLGLNSEIAF